MRHIQLHSPNIKTNIRGIIEEELGDREDLFEKSITYNQHFVTIYVFEEYFFRINSTLSVTAILEQGENGSTIDLISSGAKIGLGDVTYGAEKASLKPIVEKLVEAGFEIVEPKKEE